MWTRTPQYMVTVSCFLLNMCVFFLGSSSVGRLSYKLVFFSTLRLWEVPGLRGNWFPPDWKWVFRLMSRRWSMVTFWVKSVPDKNFDGKILRQDVFLREVWWEMQGWTYFFWLDGFLSEVVFCCWGPSFGRVACFGSIPSLSWPRYMTTAFSSHHTPHNPTHLMVI